MIESLIQNTRDTVNSDHKFTRIYNGSNLQAFANAFYVFIYLTGTKNISSANTWTVLNANALGSQYRPIRITNFTWGNSALNTSTAKAKVDTNGYVYIALNVTGSNTLHGSVMYPRQSMLP